jgi:hypothetical protein
VRAAHEDQEGGLESVVDIVGIGQQPSADAQDHRTVHPQEDFEGGLVAADDEAPQHLALGEARAGSEVEESVDLSEDGSVAPDRHATSAGAMVFLPYCGEAAESIQLYSD